MEENDFVSIWLEETGNPAIEELTRLNHEIAIKTSEAIIKKGLTAEDLAILLDINPAEVKSWFMGKHPFSIKTLKQISSEMDLASYPAELSDRKGHLN